MNENQKNFQQELSFLDFWHIFTRNIIFISLTTIFFLVLSFIYGWIILTPNYVSNADVMVQVEQDSSLLAQQSQDSFLFHQDQRQAEPTYINMD